MVFFLVDIKIYFPWKQDPITFAPLKTNIKHNPMSTKLFTALSMTAHFLVACGPSEAEIQAKKDQAIADSLAIETGKVVTYTVDPSASGVMWSGNMTGASIYSHSGEMKFVKGELITKGGILQSGAFVVDMNSVSPTDTAYSAKSPKENLVGHLSSADFFDVANNPTAMLTILSVEGNTAKAELTVRGKTDTETITDIQSTVNADGTMTGSGKMTFDRQKYGVAFPGPAKDLVIANNIDLTVKITAKAN